MIGNDVAIGRALKSLFHLNPNPDKLCFPADKRVPTMGTMQAVGVDQNRRLRVFLCHSSGDKPVVRELYRRLKMDGFEPWLDEQDLLPGQNWREEISRAVRAADVVVVCLTQKSVSKEGYLQKEIGDALAVAEEKPEGVIFIIPARFEQVEVPARLSQWQWANLFEDGGYRRLVDSLTRRAANIGVGLLQFPVSTIATSANDRVVQKQGKPKSETEGPSLGPAFDRPSVVSASTLERSQEEEPTALVTETIAPRTPSGPTNKMTSVPVLAVMSRKSQWQESISRRVGLYAILVLTIVGVMLVLVFQGEKSVQDDPGTKVVSTLSSRVTESGSPSATPADPRIHSPAEKPPIVSATKRDLISLTGTARATAIRKALDLANTQRDGGHYSDAIKTYNQVLKLDPGNTEAKTGLAKAQQAAEWEVSN